MNRQLKMTRITIGAAISVLLITACIFSGCFTMKKPTASVPKVSATFDYSPPSRQSVGSTDITVALISPVFISKENEYLISPFKEMSQGMSNDFEELLTAKGFKIRGPFRSRDEMVYGDKLSSDFAISVEIDLRPTYDRKFDYSPGIGAYVPASYHMHGDITFAGSLILTASSPKYGEKIWKKSIALDPIQFSYVGTVKWSNKPSVVDELQKDNQFYNAMVTNLQAFYNKSLALTWQQIDPAEMKTIVPQAKKADVRQ